MSSDKSDNDNLEIFLNNLNNWMINSKTNEEYVNDGHGITLTKIIEMLRKKWKDWKPLAFVSRVAKEKTQDLYKDLLPVKCDAEAVVLDDDDEDSKEKKEKKEEEAELDVCLKSCAFKIGCFVSLFNSMKDLNRNGNDNNDNNSNKNDISSVVNIFRKYIEEFECSYSRGEYRFLLSGINVCEKEKQSMYDVISETENDYLQKLFNARYRSVYGVSPMTTIENESIYVSLSNELLNDLKTLGLENVRIKKMDNNNGRDGCRRITVLGRDINHIGAEPKQDSSLSMSTFEKFECLLIGCTIYWMVLIVRI